MLNTEGVSDLFKRCLFQHGEDAERVRVEGIWMIIDFNADHLRAHTAEIEAMLDELPDVFKKNVGGGMSFLQACLDKNGNQWTGFHVTMEQLFLLGIAIGKIDLLFPRELWPALPGGMPYFVIN